MIGQQGATIVSVTEETKIQKKPVGLNTVTLLKACSKGNTFEFANFLELKLVDFFSWATKIQWLFWTLVNAMFLEEEKKLDERIIVPKVLVVNLSLSTNSPSEPKYWILDPLSLSYPRKIYTPRIYVLLIVYFKSRNCFALYINWIIFPLKVLECLQQLLCTLLSTCIPADIFHTPELRLLRMRQALILLEPCRCIYNFFLSKDIEQKPNSIELLTFETKPKTCRYHTREDSNAYYKIKQLI